MKQILALTFAAATLILASCAHTGSCCAEGKGGSCCDSAKPAKAGECKECDAAAKPGTNAAKKDAHQH